MGLINEAGGVDRPGQVLRDMGPQNLEAGDMFNSRAINVDRFVCVSLLLP